MKDIHYKALQKKIGTIVDMMTGDKSNLFMFQINRVCLHK